MNKISWKFLMALGELLLILGVDSQVILFLLFYLRCCICFILHQKPGVCLIFRTSLVIAYHLLSLLSFLLRKSLCFSFFNVHYSTNLPRRILHIWQFLPVKSLHASNAKCGSSFNLCGVINFCPVVMPVLYRQTSENTVHYGQSLK